jgi:2-polyprenyl-3-methyl-5-hydroxy-6-metoxy-1,4-benzoquinol methylase
LTEIHPSVLDIIQWDTMNWSQALQCWNRAFPLGLSGKKCLEIGSSAGGLSLWAASKGARVLCTDIVLPGTRAASLHAQYGVQDLVSYATLDASTMSFREEFDIILFKSVLGAIGRTSATQQDAAVRRMYEALKPGGCLLFAENLRGSRMHRALRKHFVSWSANWRYVSLQEMRSYLRCFAQVAIKTCGVVAAFGRNEVQRHILGRLDRALLTPLFPAAWHYIVYGIAQK